VYIQVFAVSNPKVDQVIEKTYTLVVRVVNFKKIPIENVNVKIFRLEKEGITLNQWAENLRNGSPFKRLILSMNTDNNGNVSAELPEGVYEANVELYGLNNVCDLTQNTEILLVEPKKHWW
jgi:hypothetical protein